MSRLALAALALVAACGPPGPTSIDLAITNGSDQACPSQNCTAIPMPCAAVLSIRILDPDDPSAPYVSVCKPVTPDHDMDLCSIDSVELPSDVTLPDKTLAVEVAIYPASTLATDGSGNYICPTDVVYSASTGFPSEVSPSPSIGGRAFYHPDDSKTVVELGCTDLSALDAPACTGGSGVDITASVIDFDSQLAVTASLASSLTVSVGEPQPQPDMTGSGTVDGLAPADTRQLELTTSGTTATWVGTDLDVTLHSSVCLDVLTDEPETTAALTCRSVAAGSSSLDLHGVKLVKSTLDTVLDAFGPNTQFPDAGLVVGIVVDDTGQAAPGITVVPAAPAGAAHPTIKYLSPDGNSYGAAPTTTNGVFVSTDAVYGTTWSAVGNGGESAMAFGGLVEGKVTIVVLQLAKTVIGG
jgi:hypothetical protein